MYVLVKAGSRNHAHRLGLWNKTPVQAVSSWHNLRVGEHKSVLHEGLVVKEGFVSAENSVRKRQPSQRI